MNQLDLNDRVAIITGGSGGIGLATVGRMLKSGAKIIIWDRDQASLDAARALHPEVSCVAVDVTSEASIASATEKAIAEHGRIDILVNAAGIIQPKTLIVEFPADLWRRVIEVNLTGTFLCCKAVTPHMLKRNYGRIVNLGSISGKEGNPFSSAYSASKAGVHSLTKSLAKETATTGVRVNCVAPAIIATDNLFHSQPEEMQKMWVSRVPMGRAGRPDEVAALISWLASEDCSFSTGAAFDLSGGRATY